MPWQEGKIVVAEGTLRNYNERRAGEKMFSRRERETLSVSVRCNADRKGEHG